MMNSKLPSVGTLTLSLLALALLSGCAGMGSGYEPPTVAVQSFKPVQSGDASGLPTFEIGLHVINPNLEPLELAGVSYTISLGGQDLIKGVGNDLPTRSRPSSIRDHSNERSAFPTADLSP